VRTFTLMRPAWLTIATCGSSFHESRPHGNSFEGWTVGASAGATASASSRYSASFPAAATIDGEQAGVNWSAGGGWADGTSDVFPDSALEHHG
jgi:hypothetical protein